jgi:hypothetical protein
MTFSRLIRARVIAGVVGSLCLVVGDVLITPLVDFGDKANANRMPNTAR